MQHITYMEWLPTLLSNWMNIKYYLDNGITKLKFLLKKGATALTAAGLQSSAPGFYTTPVASATSGPISNEFATAT